MGPALASAKRLALGSAQFGLGYGATNAAGQVPAAEVARIVAAASDVGVDLIDTAPAYGEAETVLGHCGLASTIRLVSKTPRFHGRAIGAAEVTALRDGFARSCAALGRRELHGLLLHHVEDLLAPGGADLLAAMRDLQAAGRVAKVGVSVYTADEIDRALSHGPMDLVQLPFSLVDQRLLHSGHLARLQKAGVEIHARSIFLQGLLLQAPETLAPRFAGFAPRLVAIAQQCRMAAVTPLRAALGFVLGCATIDRAIVGVTSLAEFQATCHAVGPLPPAFDWQACAATDEAWLHPGRWPRS